MKSVSRCQYTGSGIIAHAEDEKGVTRRINLADVRAGVVFPTGSLPGYYVLFGRKWERLPSGKRPLIYLTEGEDLIHETLFGKLTDACMKYTSKTIYACMPRQDRAGGIGGFDDLWRYLKNKHLNINLVAAPAAPDIDYGKAIAAEYWTDKALDIPDMDLTPTILRRQLKQMIGLVDPERKKRQTDEADIATLYAFHALRYVLAGFVKFNNVIQYGRENVKDPRRNPKGWT